MVPVCVYIEAVGPTTSIYDEDRKLNDSQSPKHTKTEPDIIKLSAEEGVMQRDALKMKENKVTCDGMRLHNDILSSCL